ncbi:MAG: type II toxin-antitoxin system RelE/ParE family toxin [Gemmataceae bacterium]|nr:type II toxin-antitoxin system RelE/ParE family toxin [Gemmataceae bacterium]
MPNAKPVRWIGRSYEDLCAFPREARRAIGYALQFAQMGDKHPSAKPLKGFGGAGVLEIVEDHDGNSYRAVYTVKFSGAVYVLHAFQKKSKKGIETPKHEIEVVKKRLARAQEDHRARRDKPGDEP